MQICNNGEKTIGELIVLDINDVTLIPSAFPLFMGNKVRVKSIFMETFDNSIKKAKLFILF